MREWFVEWWPLVVFPVVLIGVLALLIMITPDMYIWDAAKCTAVGVHDGVPVYECVGVPR
jgi:hypothetical protein